MTAAAGAIPSGRGGAGRAASTTPETIRTRPPTAATVIRSPSTIAESTSAKAGAR